MRSARPQAGARHAVRPPRLRPRCHAASGLVLADEPSGALDDAHATAVIDILRETSGAGCAVVPATHDAAVRDRCDAVFAVHESSLVNAPRRESTHS